MDVLILNGPNLNLLGKREPEIYGNQSFDDYLTYLQESFPKIRLSYFQSNIEGDIINKLHEVGFKIDYIILNAGGYTHTSVAIADAITSINTPVIEVHISNIYAREEFRRNSLISKNCFGVISGFGIKVYKLALESLF